MFLVQKNKNGLWANILTSKVSKKENCCFIRRKDIHVMHISILPIVDAFEALQKKFLKEKGNTARMNTPLDQLELIVQTCHKNCQSQDVQTHQNYTLIPIHKREYL
jgi:hypothetical protein